MDMNESERDNNHFEESMLETLKSLESIQLKEKYGKKYDIKKINGISMGCEFILGED